MQLNKKETWKEEKTTEGNEDGERSDNKGNSR
jgi:hypothetical protein